MHYTECSVNNRNCFRYVFRQKFRRPDWSPDPSFYIKKCRGYECVMQLGSFLCSSGTGQHPRCSWCLFFVRWFPAIIFFADKYCLWWPGGCVSKYCPGSRSSPNLSNLGIEIILSFFTISCSRLSHTIFSCKKIIFAGVRAKTENLHYAQMWSSFCDVLCTQVFMQICLDV